MSWPYGHTTHSSRSVFEVALKLLVTLHCVFLSILQLEPYFSTVSQEDRAAQLTAASQKSPKKG